MGKLEQLQELLGVNSNRRELDRLDHRVADEGHRTADVAEVLPAALKTADTRGTLSASLSLPVERAIHESVNRNPKVFADVLFPVMGPAIRRSITEALKSFVEGLNQAMEQRLSPRAIGWRIQAWKTGIPYREIILSQTLQFRVRLAFLIHRPSGLLVHHSGERREGDIDEDAFSAMLTAIQDFIRDSTDQANENSVLSSAEIGEHTVWVFSGYAARLAVVIDGHPPLSTRSVLTEKLEQIHNQQGLWLKQFDGGQSIPNDVEELVDACILAEEKVRERSRLNPGMLVVVAFLMSVVLWGGYRLYGNYQSQKMIQQIDAAFAAEPGVVLIRRYQNGSNWVLEGLADPLARSPEEIIGRLRLPTESTLRFRAYYAADAVIEAKRLIQELSPPPAVAIEAVAGRIFVRGVADPDWIASLSQSISRKIDPDRYDTDDLAMDWSHLLDQIREELSLPSTASLQLDGDQLVLTGSGPPHLKASAVELASNYPHVTLVADGYQDEMLVAVAELKRVLDSVQIQFTEAIDPEEGSAAKLDQAAQIIKDTLATLSRPFIGWIDLTGLSDSTGSMSLNYQLRLQRANWVRDELIRRGVEADHLRAFASTSDYGEDRSWRRVSFKVRAAGDE